MSTRDFTRAVLSPLTSWSKMPVRSGGTTLARSVGDCALCGCRMYEGLVHLCSAALLNGETESKSLKALGLEADQPKASLG